MTRILVVDDETILREALVEHMTGEGLESRSASGVEEALAMLRRDDYSVVLTDLRMQPLDGLELLRRVTAEFPETEVMVMTAYASTESAVAALRLGACDYLLKPVDFSEVTHKVRRVLRHRRLLRENRLLKQELHNRYGFHNIVARSKPMQKVFQVISKVAATDTTVLISGASGTGKELVARAIHHHSRRSGGRFVAVNLSALPESLVESELFGYVKGAFTGADHNKEGLFTSAGGGTLFLDEVSEVPYHFQVKLLRALEQREITPVGGVDPVPVDIRILAATNRDLQQLCEQGKFREDLYFRLNVVEVHLPGLSERPEDIPLLVNHFISRFNREMNKSVTGVSNEVMQILKNHTWRGHVRELENAVERAMIFCDGRQIRREHLPSVFQDGSLRDYPDDLNAALRMFEARRVRLMLERCDQDKNAAAARLGISVSSLYRKLASERGSS